MAKSFKEIMNTPVVDILNTPVDTDMSFEGFKRAFGIGKKAKPEDMKKRITEKSYPGKNVKPTKPIKKITKKEVSVEMPEGIRGSVDRTDDVIGPNMGRINRDEEVPVRELSSRASDEDIARIARDEDRKSWVDPHEQARRSMGFGTYKKGGAVKKKSGGCGMKAGGSVKSSASRRGDGCAVRGKTKGRMV